MRQAFVCGVFGGRQSAATFNVLNRHMNARPSARTGSKGFAGIFVLTHCSLRAVGIEVSQPSRESPESSVGKQALLFFKLVFVDLALGEAFFQDF